MALRPTLLVVTNDLHARRFLQIALSARGYDATFAADEASAVAAVRVRTPHLLLVDMTMPGGEGLRLLERLDAEPPGGIPVLALVGAGYADANTTEPELAGAIESALGRRTVAAA